MNVLACCDSKYFLEHHKAFYLSAKKVSYTPHIVVVNPTREVKNISNNLENIHYIFQENPDIVQYSINRFIIADTYIGSEGVLITDIDCFFNKKLPEIKEDVGVFLREYEKFPGMKVAAGIVWLNSTEKGKLFAQELKNKINQKPKEWYVDQYALYETYLELKNSISVFTFSQEHMDWEFTNTSYMWTGKGDRKHKNVSYLKRKRNLENEIFK